MDRDTWWAMAHGAAKESNMTQRLNNNNNKEGHSAIKNKGMLREKKQFSENKTYDGNYKFNRYFRDKVGEISQKEQQKR